MAAVDVRVKLHGLGDQSAPPQILRREEAAPTLILNSEFSWPLMMSMNTARSFEVLMSWREDEEERTESQHVSA